MSVFTYLAEVPYAELSSLYERSKWTCQAVMRAVPPLAQQIIYRLLYLENGLSYSVIRSWVSMKGTNKLHEALVNLFHLAVCRAPSVDIAADLTDTSTVFLNESFAAQIKAVLCERDDTDFNRNDIAPSQPILRVVQPSKPLSISLKVKAPSLPADGAEDDEADVVMKDAADPGNEGGKSGLSLEEIDEQCLTSWQLVLRYVLDPTSSAPRARVLDLLRRAGILSQVSEKGKKKDKITDEGFKFLLQDSRDQLWAILMELVLEASEPNTAEALESRDHILSFLFQLGFSSAGYGYATKALHDDQRTMLPLLQALGLIYIPKDDDTYFYPSSHGVGVGGASVSPSSAEVRDRKGYIIVETNFKLYAYTNSELDIRLIGLFVKLQYTLPNLAVGLITRGSVRNALNNGITANQILSFLRQHAHPKTLNRKDGRGKRKPIIPDTVCDEIKLWEAEKDRIIFTPAVLYEKFERPALARRLSKQMADMDCLLWEGNDSRGGAVLLGPVEAHADVKAFIAENKKNLS